MNTIDLFLIRKPVEILILIKQNDRSYPRNVTYYEKRTSGAGSYTRKTIRALEKFGLVTLTKRGRIKIVKLTNIGREIAKDLENIYNKLNR